MLDELFKRYQFSGLIDQSDIEAVFGSMHLKQLSKGAVFIRPGDPCYNFGVVVEGVARHYYVADDGKEWTKSFAGPGDILGVYSELLQKLDSRTFIETVTPVKILQGGKRELDLMQTDKWDKFWRRLAEDHFIKKENREYEFLKYDAAARYEAYMNYYSHLDAQIPRKYVASYLGITPQALSRIVKD